MNTAKDNRAESDVELLLEVACEEDPLPSRQDVLGWIEALFAALPPRPPVEISMRVVDSEEMRELNSRYRGKATPTNVLSFPCELPEGVNSPLLGDLAICAEVVNREAAEQGKQWRDHWAHIVAHGSLHLLGFDHETHEEAERMESLEIAILEKLGIANPYEITSTQQKN